MSQENVELVRAACEWANRTRDFDIGDLIHPDFEWHTRQDLPDAGARKGNEGVVRLRAEWVEAFEDFRINVEDWIDGGDQVVTVSRLRGRIRGTGHELDVPETQVSAELVMSIMPPVGLPASEPIASTRRAEASVPGQPSLPIG